MPSNLFFFQTTCHRNKKIRKAILKARKMLTLSDLRFENYELLDSDESEANENDGCDLNEDVIAC